MPNSNNHGATNGSQDQVSFIINRTLRIGGVERKIADIANFLTESGELEHRKVFLLLNDTEPENPEEAVFYDSVANSQVQVLTMVRPWLLSRSLPFLVFILWKTLLLRPDTILAFLRWPGLAAVLAKILFWWRNIRVVISQDCLASRALESEIGNPAFRCLMGSLVRTMYPLANLIISPSEHTKQDMVAYFSIAPQNVMVNRNWVAATAPERKEPLDYDLIFAGRVDKIKNIPMLMDVICEVVKELPDIRVCIVGAGDDLDNALAIAKSNGLLTNISFFGFQKDVGCYLARSKVFCLTSHHEALPMAALEAMAYGLPVVSTSYPGVDKLVVQGKTGFICHSRDDFQVALTKLLTDDLLLAQMASDAKQHAESHHNLKNLESLLALVYSGAGQPEASK